MNLNNTKFMHSEDTVIIINNKVIEKVEEYIYLGQKIIPYREIQTKEIKRRRKLAWAAFGKLNYTLRNQQIQLHLKSKVFGACIIPILTCAAQTWTITKKNMNILRVTQHAMERAMLGISVKDKKTNTWIRQKTKVTDVVQKSIKLKWEYAGHF
ncbi:unnamed protein product [Diabrotica balteata]|uniref:Uncharacterized protein n=1 Tax=Diabrotica balteata TaxID=107213 RepID=A0A9N9XEC2_DIABA|nr:unnamed protein product [Diabrotica balteata]